MRLLYLLLRQRVREERVIASTAPLSSSRRSGLLAAAFAALAVGSGVAGLIALGHFGAAPPAPAETATETATLHVHVETVDAAPVVVFLDAPGQSRRDVRATPSDTARLQSVNNLFEPRFQVAPLAASIEVGNNDSVPHNTHLYNGQRTVFNVALPLSGSRVRKVLPRPGINGVRCDLHPWMQAWIFVPPSAHHAVMWEPGTATLRDIPPGRYRLHVWAPARGESTRMLTLASGETQSLALFAPR